MSNMGVGRAAQSGTSMVVLVRVGVGLVKDWFSWRSMIKPPIDQGFKGTGLLKMRLCLRDGTNLVSYERNG